MNSHLILPSSMVKPFILHLLHRTTLDSDLTVWIYGDNIPVSDIEDYIALHKILSELMGADVMKGINEISKLEIPDKYCITTPGLSSILGIADKIVTEQLAPKISPEDEIIITGTSQLGLGIALAFKYHNIVRKSPRVVTTIDIKSSTSLENIKLLFDEYSGNIRIDVVNVEKAKDILTVARAIEAIEPPDEPNGVYITKIDRNAFYYRDSDLPTPVTGISMRTLMQLRHNLTIAKTNQKFLKKIRAERSFPNFYQLRILEKSLDNLENYLIMVRNEIRSEFVPMDMTKELISIPSQPDGFSSEYYCKIALKHILNSSFEVLDIVNEGCGALKMSIPEIDIKEINFKEAINPFSIAEATLQSFRNPTKSNIELRSRCLDMWEVFMNESHPSEINVDEIRTIDGKSKWDIYRTLPYSEVLISQKALYKINVDDECIAITSPYTGFAVMNNNNISDFRELSERSIELKQFIYDYVMNIPGFSDEFKEYVTDNCKTKELSDTDKNLFTKYPHLGRKIPIY